MFEIEKGIPIPEPLTKSRKGESKYPLDKLMVGESFLVPVGKARERLQRRRAIAASVHYYKRDHQKKGFAIRLVDDGVRVWRIK